MVATVIGTSTVGVAALGVASLRVASSQVEAQHAAGVRTAHEQAILSHRETADHRIRTSTRWDVQIEKCAVRAVVLGHRTRVGAHQQTGLAGTAHQNHETKRYDTAPNAWHPDPSTKKCSNHRVILLRYCRPGWEEILHSV